MSIACARLQATANKLQNSCKISFGIEVFLCHDVYDDRITKNNELATHLLSSIFLACGYSFFVVIKSRLWCLNSGKKVNFHYAWKDDIKKLTFNFIRFCKDFVKQMD